MELTKPERIVLMSLAIDSMGVEALIELLGQEDVEKLDAIATDLVGNTTPNEMSSIGPAIIKKLAASILDEVKTCDICGGELEVNELYCDDKTISIDERCPCCG